MSPNRLSIEQCFEIGRLHRGGLSMNKLADRYDVAVNTIRFTLKERLPRLTKEARLIRAELER